jgi:hypothetical protein
MCKEKDIGICYEIYFFIFHLQGLVESEKTKCYATGICFLIFDIRIREKRKRHRFLQGDFIRNMLANATPHGHHRAHANLFVLQILLPLPLCSFADDLLCCFKGV